MRTESERQKAERVKLMKVKSVYLVYAKRYKKLFEFLCAKKKHFPMNLTSRGEILILKIDINDDEEKN